MEEQCMSEHASVQCLAQNKAQNKAAYLGDLRPKEYDYKRRRVMPAYTPQHSSRIDRGRVRDRGVTYFIA
jgi:hypothetical protein